MSITLTRLDPLIQTETALDPPVDGGVRATQFKWSQSQEYFLETSTEFTNDGENGKYILMPFASPFGLRYNVEYFNELTIQTVLRGGTSGTSAYEVDYQLFHKNQNGRMIPTTDLTSHFFQPITGQKDNISAIKYTDTNFDRETVFNIDMVTQSTRKPFDNSTGDFFPLITNTEYQKSTILHNGLFNNYTQQELFLYFRVKNFTVGQPFPSLIITVMGAPL